MNISTCNNDYSNIQQFSDLYGEKISTESIDILKKSASQGDLRSIELLSNLALRQDEHGKLAEKILFDLFCGKIPSHDGLGVIEAIQDSAYMLYQLSTIDKMKNNTDMHKLRTPSKLLYMAGSAVSRDEKLSLSRLFSQESHIHSQYEQVGDVDIWNPARMVTTDEINTILKNYARQYNTPEINFPIGLIHPASQENMLVEQIISKLDQHSMTTQTFRQPEFFPVNTGDHWVTFGLYTDDDTQLHAVICNTSNALSSQTKQHIIDAANLAGVTDPHNIVFLEKDIQAHIPNGCGLLTIEAMKSLMDNNFQSPVEVLQTFLSSFTDMSAQEQEQYNQQNRYFTYAETYIQ